MADGLLPSLKIERSLSVHRTFDDAEEKEYWRSRTPLERLRHTELLRRINYGHRAAERLQRVLKVIEYDWR